jgi:hypothetical protein
VRSPSPVSRGRMSSIVLAARLRARAMPRHSQRSSPPDIAVRRTASFGRLCRWSMLTWRPRVPVESTAQAPLRHGNDERKERNKKHRKRNADRRNWYSAVPSGTAAPGSPGAHLSAFHRGSGLGDRTPPPSFSSALPELVPLSGRYPRTGQPQCSDASRRPVVMPVGRISRSCPGAACNSARGRRTRPVHAACRPQPVRLGEVRSICN